MRGVSLQAVSTYQSPVYWTECGSFITIFVNCVDIDSSDEEEEESDISDYGEIKNLKLSNSGLSVADVIQQANSQNLKVGLVL